MPAGLRTPLLAAALAAMLSTATHALPSSPADRATALLDLQSLLLQYQLAKSQLGTIPPSEDITLALQPLLEADAAEQQQEALRLGVLLSDLRANTPDQTDLEALLAQAQQRLEIILAAVPAEPCAPGTVGCVPTATPEPGTLVLFAGAIAALALRRRSEG